MSNVIMSVQMYNQHWLHQLYSLTCTSKSKIIWSLWCEYYPHYKGFPCLVFVINGVTPLFVVSVLPSLNVIGANIGRQSLFLTICNSRKNDRSDTLFAMIGYSSLSRLIDTESRTLYCFTASSLKNIRIFLSALSIVDINAKLQID